MANLTVNTKKYGQITLNTKPHSDLQQQTLLQQIAENGIKTTKSLPGQAYCRVTPLNKPTTRPQENQTWKPL